MDGYKFFFYLLESIVGIVFSKLCHQLYVHKVVFSITSSTSLGLLRYKQWTATGIGFFIKRFAMSSCLASGLEVAVAQSLSNVQFLLVSS